VLLWLDLVKLTPEITTENRREYSTRLTYKLAAESAGVTYKTLNEWNQKDRQIIWKILPVCTIYPKMQCGWGFEASGTLKRSRKSWKLLRFACGF